MASSYQGSLSEVALGPTRTIPPAGDPLLGTASGGGISKSLEGFLKVALIQEILISGQSPTVDQSTPHLMYGPKKHSRALQCQSLFTSCSCPPCCSAHILGFRLQTLSQADFTPAHLYRCPCCSFDRELTQPPRPNSGSLLQEVCLDGLTWRHLDCL